MMCKKAPKVNRGQLRAARAAQLAAKLNVPIELPIKLEIGAKVRVISLSLSRSERSIWAGKHGTIANISAEHGMTIAHVRLINSWKIIKVPLAELKSIEPGREYAEKETNPTSIWNPMQSPFPTFH